MYQNVEFQNVECLNQKIHDKINDKTQTFNSIFYQNLN